MTNDEKVDLIELLTVLRATLFGEPSLLDRCEQWLNKLKREVETS